MNASFLFPTPTPEKQVEYLAADLQRQQRRQPERHLLIIFRTNADALGAVTTFQARGWRVEMDGDWTGTHVSVRCPASDTLKLAQIAVQTGIHYVVCDPPRAANKSKTPDVGTAGHQVVVDCKNEEHQTEVLTRLEDMDLKCTPIDPPGEEEPRRGLALMAQRIADVRDELECVKKKISIDYEYTKDGRLLLKLGGATIRLPHEHDNFFVTTTDVTARDGTAADEVREWHLEVIPAIERFVELTEKLLNIVDGEEPPTRRT